MRALVDIIREEHFLQTLTNDLAKREYPPTKSNPEHDQYIGPRR